MRQRTELEDICALHDMRSVQTCNVEHRPVHTSVRSCLGLGRPLVRVESFTVRKLLRVGRRQNCRVNCVKTFFSSRFASALRAHDTAAALHTVTVPPTGDPGATERWIRINR
jgi:hypothetical protein